MNDRISRWINKVGKRKDRLETCRDIEPKRLIGKINLEE